LRRYAPTGKTPNHKRYHAWKTCADHVKTLYKCGANGELEQILNQATSGRKGEDMAAWIGRVSRGECCPRHGDLPLSTSGKLKTEDEVWKFARMKKISPVDREGLASVWVFRKRLEMIPQRSDGFRPVWLRDPFVEFQKWQCREPNEAVVDVFLLSVCLLVAFIDPYELGIKFRMRLDIDKIRRETVHLLKAIVDWPKGESGFYKLENEQIAKWLMECGP